MSCDPTDNLVRLLLLAFVLLAFETVTVYFHENEHKTVFTEFGVDSEIRGAWTIPLDPHGISPADADRLNRIQRDIDAQRYPNEIFNLAVVGVLAIAALWPRFPKKNKGCLCA